MELRTLKYFLAIVREGSISNAAKTLHVTQPTLSRQLASLEIELGQQLYTRTNKGIELTEQGVILNRYAESIVELADKAEEDISLSSKAIAGSVHIGAGETQAMGILADAMLEVRRQYPQIEFQLYSGTTADLMDNLVKGQYDFMVECEVQAHVNLNVLKLPIQDHWGLLTRRDNPLARLERIRPQDLVGQPIISSRQGSKLGILGEWFNGYADDIVVTAKYNLPLNSKFLIRAGLGSAIMYEGLIDTDDMSDLVFIPLDPPLASTSGLVWRKVLPTKQAQVFLDVLTRLCAQRAHGK